MLRCLKDNITGEPFLRDHEGRDYRRTVCALGWPWSPLPGCVLVLGEMRHAPTTLGERRHIRLLFEEWSTSPAKLLETAERALRLYGARRIITPEDDPRIALVDADNDARREDRRVPLRTESPLAWHGRGEGLLPYYLSLLHARVKDSKTLFLGASSRLPGDVALADSETTPPQSAMLQWPGLCALAWAVEALDMQPVREWHARATLPGGPADALGGY